MHRKIHQNVHWYAICNWICIDSLSVDILDQSGTFTTADEPALTYYHPKSIVDIQAPSVCGTCYGFGQMCDDRYLLLYHHTEQFHYLKNSLYSVNLFLPPQYLRTFKIAYEQKNNLQKCKIIWISQLMVLTVWFWLKFMQVISFRGRCAF
jgi:hypothetical protein